LEKILGVIRADDFNFALTNLLIDLYSTNYERHFKELTLCEKEFSKLDKEALDKLTKIAAVVEYVGNRRENAILYDWIYSEKLKLDTPYTPGVGKGSFARIRRIFSAPREFSLRNVFYEEETIKPV
jgi:hypothetical protein